MSDNLSELLTSRNSKLVDEVNPEISVRLFSLNFT